MKKLFVLMLLVLAMGMTACSPKAEKKEEAKPEAATEQKKEEKEDKKEDSTKSAKEGEAEVIKVGVTPVPHAEVMELIKDDLEKEGVKLEIVEFNDYIVPNMALNDGDLDANFFQHEPYLKDMVEKNKLNIVSIGNVHIEPIALYSDKYKSIEEIPEGASILIPNDVTNGSRALLLMEKAGLIKLKDPTDINATEIDITENPKNLKFTAMSAEALPMAYKDADAAIINSNYAIKGGLNPVKDGLMMEDINSPYANLVAVRKGEENEEKFKKLMNALHSEKVKQFLEEKYEGAVVPAF